MSELVSLRLGTKVRICLNDHGIEPGTVGTFRTPAANRDFSVIDVPGKGRVLLASHEFDVVEGQNGRVWADRDVSQPAITPVVAPAEPEAPSPPSSPEPFADRPVADKPASRGPLPKSMGWARDWAGLGIEPYIVAEDAMTLLGISRPTMSQYHDVLGWDCCEKKGCRFYGRHLVEIRELEELRRELDIPIMAAIRVRDRLRAATAAAQETQKA